MEVSAQARGVLVKYLQGKNFGVNSYLLGPGAGTSDGTGFHDIGHEERTVKTKGRYSELDLVSFPGAALEPYGKR
jgi:hypothetical protein